MKVFISWSGPQSKAVALLLKPWLSMILQATEPWMSDLDIDPGARWSQEIAGELKTSKMGIICVTPENQGAAWIQFEAGALSMALGDIERRVVPLLIGFSDRSEVQSGPLDVFNNVMFDEPDMWKLVKSINGQLQQPLGEEPLKGLFDTFWPRLKSQVDDLRRAGGLTTAERRGTPEMLADILDTVRDIQKQTRRANGPIVPRPTDDRTAAFTHDDYVQRVTNLHMGDRIVPEQVARAILATLQPFGGGTLALSSDGTLRVLTPSLVSAKVRDEVMVIALNSGLGIQDIKFSFQLEPSTDPRLRALEEDSRQ